MWYTALRALQCLQIRDVYDSPGPSYHDSVLEHRVPSAALHELERPVTRSPGRTGEAIAPRPPTTPTADEPARSARTQCPVDPALNCGKATKRR